jgi:hypothetical protein
MFKPDFFIAALVALLVAYLVLKTVVDLCVRACLVYSILKEIIVRRFGSDGSDSGCSVKALWLKIKPIGRLVAASIVCFFVSGLLTYGAFEAFTWFSPVHFGSFANVAITMILASLSLILVMILEVLASFGFAYLVGFFEELLTGDSEIAFKIETYLHDKKGIPDFGMWVCIWLGIFVGLELGSWLHLVSLSSWYGALLTALAFLSWLTALNWIEEIRMRLAGTKRPALAATES